jgi:hypothetical protein
MLVVYEDTPLKQFLISLSLYPCREVISPAYGNVVLQKTILSIMCRI